MIGLETSVLVKNALTNLMLVVELVSPNNASYECAIVEKELHKGLIESSSPHIQGVFEENPRLIKIALRWGRCREMGYYDVSSTKKEEK
jgi:hypothetical protein